jgi:hypothetical protein
VLPDVGSEKATRPISPQLIPETAEPPPDQGAGKPLFNNLGASLAAASHWAHSLLVLTLATISEKDSAVLQNILQPAHVQLRHAHVLLS